MAFEERQWCPCSFAPAIAELCNKSFVQATFPDSHKKAVVSPLLKKPTLDPSELGSYRPISNLSFISKMLERLVDHRFVKHTDKHDSISSTQSAYRTNYSTETVLVRLHNDIVTAIDRDDVGALILLDLSAAFDTVDHTIIRDVLRKRFGIEGGALEWMASIWIIGARSSQWVQTYLPFIRCPVVFHKGQYWGQSNSLCTETKLPIFSTCIVALCLCG